MTIVEMLRQSGVLSLLGMAVVFGFLIMLVICITLAGKVIRAIGADKDLRQQPGASTGARAPAGGENGAVTAAISAAVNEYDKSHP
ncbi:MAG: OadG family protein [Treponema sp.]|jgi:oxaloacetate decarboxylase gamma subunit|nr:OadG family protein [Treponema sp.]